jgi:hypothetical protein
MLDKTKIALSIAIVLGTASGAFAATKHHRHTAPVANGSVSASAYGANASIAGHAVRADDPPGSAFQDAGFRAELGYPPR